MVTIRLAYSPYGIKQQMRIVREEVPTQNDNPDTEGDDGTLRQERNSNE